MESSGGRQHSWEGWGACRWTGWENTCWCTSGRSRSICWCTAGWSSAVHCCAPGRSCCTRVAAHLAAVGTRVGAGLHAAQTQRGGVGPRALVHIWMERGHASGRAVAHLDALRRTSGHGEQPRDPLRTPGSPSHNPRKPRRPEPPQISPLMGSLWFWLLGRGDQRPLAPR